MTFRVIWGDPFPEWIDYPTREQAERHADRCPVGERPEIVELTKERL